jgi:signal transduction histidine kinase
MAHALEPHVLEAFRADTRRIMSRRIPGGIAFFVALVVVAGLIEVTNYPDRWRPLLWSFGLEILLCLLGLTAIYVVGLQRYILGIIVVVTSSVAFCVSGYVIAADASGDALAFALIIFMTGVPLIYPWGAWGQIPFVFFTYVSLLVAFALGVRGELPMAYALISVAGAGASSSIGALLLDLHRRAIFHQRLLLARTRDQQAAMLHDVTRTVTATLEIEQVLWRVCQSVLHALRLQRLWLVWRPTPDGELQALLAEGDGDRVTLTPSTSEPSRWETVLNVASDARPELLELDAEELRNLVQASGVAPTHILRLPLQYQSELVGMILADAGAGSHQLESSFVDIAATLGNSAAMAIGNARLYALVLQHRAELQQLSNKRLDVVEESLRRISRELHDGTCQALMAIKLDLALLERQVPASDGDPRSALRSIRAQVLDVVQSVRQMSHLLYPPALDDFGAVAAIESMAEKYRATSDLQVRVECADATMRFAPAIELLVFRIFQEAMINVVKYAQASRVHVRLSLEEQAIVLEISDDGVGFDSQTYFRTPSRSVGLGLIGMRERVAHFGGVFRVTSRPGKGTRIFVSVPADHLEGVRVAAAL